MWVAVRSSDAGRDAGATWSGHSNWIVKESGRFFGLLACGWAARFGGQESCRLAMQADRANITERGAMRWQENKE
jgi:hypothetical protein